MTITEPEDNRRILVIDDNPAIHEDFRKILTSGGDMADDLIAAEAALFGQPSTPASESAYIIDSAYQGEEGWQRVQTALADGQPYALAFVDVRMPPGWDGIETVQHLWQVDPLLQVVICTAFSDYSWEEMIYELGATDRFLLLKKPFDNIEVRQLAMALCAKWRDTHCAESARRELQQLVETRTEQLDAQKRELEETHAQLLQAQKLESIGQLAAGIAHEINTPIQYVGDNIRFLGENVQGLFALLDQYAQLMDPSGTPQHWDDRLASIHAANEELDFEFIKDEIPAAIEQSLEGVGRVAKIIQSMKEFSHPGGNAMEMLDINRAIEATITVARNEWKYVADIKTHLDPDLPMVPCFVAELNQVFLNVIVNAAHAIKEALGVESDEKGTITITTSQSDSRAMIQIADTGTGIPDEIVDRIFDPFFTTKQVGRGTGQGLAIARTCIDKHGGELTVNSSPGKGAVFTIRLPLEKSEAISTKEQDSDTTCTVC